MSIRRINEFHATPGADAKLRQFLTDVVALVKDAPGCEGCELLQDPADSSRFAIVETWTDVAAHQAAASRVPPDMYTAFQQLIAEPPSGRYFVRVE